MSAPRILVAGIGNIFLGDDAFGVEVAQLLARQTLPEGVRVVDFGIRGFDLAYALMDDYEAAILVDTMARGEAPGTLSIIEPDLAALPDADAQGIAMHSIDPLTVLVLMRTLGGQPPPVYVVGCEPLTFGPEEGQMGLSAPVQASLVGATRMVHSLVERLLAADVGTGRREGRALGAEV
ncbi:MAG: hydrogenase maturation protease [Thermomicrobiales bacterium]